MAKVIELGPKLEANQACVTAISVLYMIHCLLLTARACGFILKINIFTFIMQVIQQNWMQDMC